MKTEGEGILRLRMTVTGWDEHYVWGNVVMDGRTVSVKARYATPSDPMYAALGGQLYKGAQINLLSVRTDAAEGVLCPEMVVLDPDFLIDITALCKCLSEYGDTAYNYLLYKFAPAVRSAAIVRGNIANQFLDDCVNGDVDTKDKELYLDSMQKSFRSSALTLCTLPGINADFFTQCRKQFANIRRTVDSGFSDAKIDIRQTDIVLEPSFLCEALGLQGRMDLLTLAGDKMVELKSGKENTYPSCEPKREHVLQMALYKEILYYSLGCARVQSFLFYSLYPKIYAIGTTRQMIRQAMSLRNDIVHLERRLATTGETEKVLSELTEAHLNSKRLCNKFYYQYLRPRIMSVVEPIQKVRDVEAAYLYRMLAFVEREQFIAKTGNGKGDTPHGFADTWLNDTAHKQAEGNILTDLRLLPVYDKDSVTAFEADLSECDASDIPNFRQGDLVLLYERNNEQDNATNKQVFRCVVESITPDKLRLHLSFRQRNDKVFKPESRYAVEHNYSDMSFRQAYAGLFSLLTAPKERKELLLGQRKPQFNTSAQLNYPHEGELGRIVSNAKRAEDYFLLVGPPGTGKTSVALKAMTKEFLSDKPTKTILLTAYTNRAVDEICAMLTSISPELHYIRIGHEYSCALTYHDHLMQNVIAHATSRKELISILSPCNVFVGTICSLYNQPELFNLKAFDVALIDEASQILEPQLLPLLCAITHNENGTQPAISKFILIGDHKQLPAVVLQSPETSRTDNPLLQQIGLTNCRNSLFQRLHMLATAQDVTEAVGMLRHQGRMHPEISAFINKHYYNGRLDIIPLPHQMEKLKVPDKLPNDALSLFVARTRLGFISVKPSSNTPQNEKVNQAEAAITARIVQTLLHIRLMNGESVTLPTNEIGIITPFRAQIAAIRKAMTAIDIDSDHITVDTVERFQGSQRNIIIFSATVRQEHQLGTLSEPVNFGDVLVDRKLNVVLTRARKQFFMIGNAPLLRRCPAYRDFINSLSSEQFIMA